MNLLNYFNRLDGLLASSKSLWRDDPFLLSVTENDWKAEHQSLWAWLMALEQSQIIAYQSGELNLVEDLLNAGFSDFAWLKGFAEFSNDTKTLEFLLPSGLSQGIPGRKLAQITSLTAIASKVNTHQSWLEWCSGCGYLGRVLQASSAKPVLSLEWQQALCDKGQSFADKHQLDMTFIQADALSQNVSQYIHREQHAVALHACGDLHVRLIEIAAKQKIQALTISPCCYHLTQDDIYQPLSKEAKQGQLTLSKQELRIPLQKTVTGGARVRRHRQLEMSYRLALAKLIQHLTGEKAYVPIPSIQKSKLADGFQAFCEWAIAQKNLNLDLSLVEDFDAWQALGETMFWQMEALGLVQGLYKRAIETWLLLDKALFLQSEGYDVTLGQFCSQEVTPRNLYLQAKRID